MEKPRQLLVSRAWAQAAIVVFLIGFAVFGFLAYRTYTAAPPIPENVLDASGETESSLFAEPGGGRRMRV
jgi:nitric oxide reductase large subunit